jgi:hypothetical protein
MKRNPTTIACWIHLGLPKQLEDPSFRELVGNIDRRISWPVRSNPTML